MREQSLVNTNKCLLIVHEQVKYVELVLACEVFVLYAALCERCQTHKTLLKLLRSLLLVRAAFLSCGDLVLESPLHDLLAHVLDALYENRLNFSPLDDLARVLAPDLPHFLLKRLNLRPQTLNGVGVISLQSSHISSHFGLHVARCHLGGEKCIHEVLEPDVFCIDVGVPRASQHTPARLV